MLRFAGQFSLLECQIFTIAGPGRLAVLHNYSTFIGWNDITAILGDLFDLTGDWVDDADIIVWIDESDPILIKPTGQIITSFHGDGLILDHFVRRCLSHDWFKNFFRSWRSVHWLAIHISLAVGNHRTTAQDESKHYIQKN